MFCCQEHFFLFWSLEHAYLIRFKLTIFDVCLPFCFDWRAFDFHCFLHFLLSFFGNLAYIRNDSPVLLIWRKDSLFYFTFYHLNISLILSFAFLLEKINQYIIRSQMFHFFLILWGRMHRTHSRVQLIFEKSVDGPFLFSKRLLYFFKLLLELCIFILN